MPILAYVTTYPESLSVTSKVETVKQLDGLKLTTGTASSKVLPEARSYLDSDWIAVTKLLDMTFVGHSIVNDIVLERLSTYAEYSLLVTVYPIVKV